MCNRPDDSSNVLGIIYPPVGIVLNDMPKTGEGATLN